MGGADFCSDKDAPKICLSSVCNDGKGRDGCFYLIRGC